MDPVPRPALARRDDQTGRPHTRNAEVRTPISPGHVSDPQTGARRPWCSRRLHGQRLQGLPRGPQADAPLVQPGVGGVDAGERGRDVPSCTVRVIRAATTGP
ncbi:hypothetical protein [Streptomyces sp. ME18-1-4]|uniref:hypothetical protein n=1 Tax=Streptomyces sp. ME18-1-4 TaxID=3028685 RepID=UPI0039F6F205